MDARIDRAVKGLRLFTRAHVLDEGAHRDAFWTYFAPLAMAADPQKAVDDEMVKAVSNEMDPAAHSDMAGKWPVLRVRFRNALEIVTRQAVHGAIPSSHEPRTLMGMTGLREMGMAPIIDALVVAYTEVAKERTGMAPAYSSIAGFEDILGTILTTVTALAPAAIGLYVARQTLKMKEKEAQAAQAATPVAPPPPPSPQQAAVPPVAAGTPWYVYAGIGASGLALGYVVLKSMRRR